MTQDTDLNDLSKDELIDRITALEDELAEGESTYSRRSVIRAAMGIAALGAMGVYSTGPATAAPTGTFPRETDDPLLKLRAARLRLYPRTSDPSSPDDGTMWYRSDL